LRYSLSFCEVTRISNHIYETVDNEGIVIDAKCAKEAMDFWSELRQKPFGLLVNCKNSFSISFEGAQKIARHPLQQKTAILVYGEPQKRQMESMMSIKESFGHHDLHKVFYGGEAVKSKAIEWLSN